MALSNALHFDQLMKLEGKLKDPNSGIHIDGLLVSIFNFVPFSHLSASTLRSVPARIMIVPVSSWVFVKNRDPGKSPGYDAACTRMEDRFLLLPVSDSIHTNRL